MSNSPSNLLTAVDLAKIKDAIAQTQEAIREGDLAKKAGINVEPGYSQLQDNLAKLQAVRDTYFPGQ